MFDGEFFLKEHNAYIESLLIRCISILYSSSINTHIKQTKLVGSYIN